MSKARTKAQGIALTTVQLKAALTQRLPRLLNDEQAREQIRESLRGLPSTEFESARLKAGLERSTERLDWQVGETLAEAYLTDHRDCEFPWPSSRDLRNPLASPAGADLVGFQKHAASARFAFGEVKTSSEAKWPPQVVASRHGLTDQLEELRDSVGVKNHLAIVYLGLRAQGANWQPTWKVACTRYLKNPADVALFGVLVHDVEPREADLKAMVDRLSEDCPAETSLELFAFYLPSGGIKTLGKRGEERA